MLRLLARLTAPVFAAVTLSMAVPAAAAEKPTVVLVHGAWADGSNWETVIPYLHRAGLKVVAVQNPMSSLEADVANVNRVIDDQGGDVLLVGHSYGGVVISEAGNNEHVKGLVYVAAFAPGPNQSVNSILSGFPPPVWFPMLHADAGGWVTWPAEAMATYFSAGLPAELQAVLASTQHPTFQGVNDAAIGATPAWTNHPTTYVVATQDQIIPAPLQQHFAGAMNATVVSIDGGHLVMLAQPEAVANAIIAAAGR
ncbi:alpha/beta fold hydrolase [Brevundimonas sp.]